MTEDNVISGKSKLDSNVQAIINKHLERAQFGLHKYSVDTDRDDTTDMKWLQHLQEELMDGAIYIQRIMKDRSFKASENTIIAFLRERSNSLDGESVEIIVRDFIEFIEQRK